MATVVASELMKDAALVVDVCMSVEDGDVVTIICDDDHTEQAAAVPTWSSHAAAGPS